MLLGSGGRESERDGDTTLLESLTNQQKNTLYIYAEKREMKERKRKREVVSEDKGRI